MKTDPKSEAWQDSLWAKWRTPLDWPGVLSLYEAAAYKRVSYSTLWRACQPGADGKAELGHQKFGTSYRVFKSEMDAYRAVSRRV